MVPEASDLTTWREQLLTSMLRIVLALGVLIGVPSIAFAIIVGEPIIAVADAVALLVLGIVTFRPSLSYRVRATTLVMLSYVLGVVLLVFIGVVAQLYLLAFPIFAAVLLGLRPAVIALVVNAITLIVAGAVDLFDTEVYIGGVDEPVEWAVVVMNFLFINTVLAVFSAVLLARLERSLDAEQAVSASLAEQLAGLASANQELEREVAERRRAEREVHRLAAAVAQARDVILISEPDGRIVYANDAYFAMWPGTASAPTNLTAVATASGPRQEIEHALASGNGWTGVLPVETSSSAELVLDAQLAPVSSPEAEVVAFVAVLRDVTHERRMEARLRRSEKLEALGTLASGTAHDFNNVLASVLAVAEMTAARSDDEDIAHSMQLIVTACERARDVVRQMMVFGRRSDLGAQPASLRELVEGSLPLLRAGLPSNIRIVTELEGDGTVIARAADLDQVITNLATNAAHAMATDPSATLTIATRVLAPAPSDDGSDHGREHAGARRVELAVSDTGTGIDPDHLESVFDPFFTTKDHAEGSGLGLASVHAIITGMGGDIDVTSSPTGTTFRILLPLVDEDPVSQEPVTSVPGDLTVAATRTVLLVDDEPVLLTVASQALGKVGYDVLTAANGADAVELFEREPGRVDVLVTDLSMPGMSGVQLIRRLRETRPDLPIVLCSGYGEAARREGLTADEVADYLAKPFTMRQLTERIAAVMEPTGDG